MTSSKDRNRAGGRWLVGVALLALGAPLAPVQSAASGLPPGLNAPAKPGVMPAFELPTATGANLRSDALQGQVVVIRFWASWWTTCRGEMPSVQRAHEQLKGNGVTVVAISIDGSGVQAAKSVVVEDKLTFPVPVDQDMAVARKFGVRGVPTTYVVDRKGRIAAQGFGPVDFDAPAFRDFVRALAKRGAWGFLSQRRSSHEKAQL